MSEPATVAVFCGSRRSARRQHMDLAADLGTELARRRLRLVYGGGTLGLMGQLERACREKNGLVYGVIPGRLLAEERPGYASGRLELVEGLAKRKQRMLELADAVIALPGGLGTLDETFEALSWRQLGLKKLQVGLLDIDGFYRPLVEQLERAAACGLMETEQLSQLIVGPEPGQLLDRLLTT